MGIDETFQNDQADEEERTRNKPKWTPVLNRQAEGQAVLGRDQKRQ